MKTSNDAWKGFGKLLLNNKYFLLLLLIGLVLLLLPTSSADKTEDKAEATAEAASEYPSFSLSEEEERLEKALGRIEGAGHVTVLLSLKNTATRELAPGADGALVISAGSGVEDAVELRYSYPEYLGAVVVCTGADSAQVRLNIAEAVSVFTGLGTDSIRVIKMNG
jgi:stage III sporulation protein AG